MASTHPFTCNTCQVAFRGGDLQRTHMQSDWHRYNLKRRVASLPPLTSEIFAEKVLANKASAAATAARATYQKKCDICDKAYFSEGAYINHLGSQKHKTLLAHGRSLARGDHGADTASMTGSTFSLGEPLELASTQDGEDSDHDYTERLTSQMSGVALGNPTQSTTPIAQPHEQQDSEEDEDEEEEDYVADLSKCLFCNLTSEDLDANALHMNKSHGFFVPEREYLVDLPGLVTYLSETIQVLHECLYCHKTAQSASGAQTHMRDRGHCMMAYMTEDEQLDVGDFYDFRSTYSDESDDDDGPAHKVSLGAHRKTVTTVQGSDGEEAADGSDDEDWESGSDTSETTIDEQTPASRKHKTSRPEHDRKDLAYQDNYELHLPTGRTAGHRSLRQYYRQNLRAYASGEDERQSRLLTSGDHSRQDQRIESNDERGRQLVSRANGGLGMVGVSEAKKREVRLVEKRQEKRAQRMAAHYEWGKNKRGNNQKHFRDHLLQ